MYTFKDIFKNSFLNGWQNQQLSTEGVLVTLLTATGIALYIFFAYRILTRKTFYSKNFNISLACVSIITAAIIITIQSNIVISLGMVGALSIVRFRTAIKNPMDLMFLFWSISVGIICGAGFSIYAICLSLVLTICIVCLNHLPIAKAPMILVISSSKLDSEPEIMKMVGYYCKHPQVKARNLTKETLNLTIELSTNNGGDLVSKLTDIDGILSASLLSHDGEVTF